MLRDLSSNNPDQTDGAIRLADPDIECADVVHFWLLSLMGRTTPAPSPHNWTVITRAFKLAEKYDSPLAIRLLLHELRRYVPLVKEEWVYTAPQTVFILGAKYNDPDLSARAIEHGDASLQPRADNEVFSATTRVNAPASPFDVSG